MYSTIKEIYKLKGLNIGNVRSPLEPVSREDSKKIEDIKNRIGDIIKKYET